LLSCARCPTKALYLRSTRVPHAATL
jgi:hypothetical protein